MGHKLWERITAFAGLETSLGKTFLSDKFCQINSVNFKRLSVARDSIEVGRSGALVNRPLWFEATSYVNLGLLFGLKRSGEKVGVDAVADSDSTIGERCRQLMATVPGDLKESAMRVFLRHHWSLLNELGPIPWFLPEAWGGVGLPTVRQAAEMPDTYEPGDVVKPPRWGPTKRDLMCAARIKEAPLTERGKLRYPVGRMPSDAPWIVQKVVMERLPVKLSVGTPSPLELSTWKRVFGTLCFDAFLTDERLFEKEAIADRAPQVLKQNRRSWQALTESANLPKPLSVKTLLVSDPPVTYLPCQVISMNSKPKPNLSDLTVVPSDWSEEDMAWNRRPMWDGEPW